MLHVYNDALQILHDMHELRNLAGLSPITKPHVEKEEEWVEFKKEGSDSRGDTLTCSGLPHATVSLMQNLNKREEFRKQALEAQKSKGEISDEKHVLRCIRARRRKERITRMMHGSSHHLERLEERLLPVTGSDTSDSDELLNIDESWEH